ncbi:MAG: type I-G CRISPR-associated protein Csb2 [Methylococcales bacterium]
MLTLSFTFPAGRYHATPWGRHVNEADVAWPPDAWRICRALIASWHRKLDAQRFPRQSLEELLTALASAAPHYRLPVAVHSHTRHYMPVRQKSTLIFDAFARIDADEELIVCWPELELTGDQVELLDALLGALGYLGRAESWLDARRLDFWDGKLNCFPGDSLVDTETGEIDSEPVFLHIPLNRDSYTAFQASFLQGLDARSLKPKERKAIESTLPESWLDALSLDTADLQAAGWSAPPAAQKILYQRPIEALRAGAASRPRLRSIAPADTVRYAVYGKPLPRIQDAVKFGEWLRQAAMGKAKYLLGENAQPTLLSGHGLPDDNRHQHAFFLAEAGEQDRIDHAIIHIPGGFDADIRWVLENLNQIQNRDGQVWRLLLEYVGEKSSFGKAVRLLEKSIVWQSRTPYLHPWHCKKNFDIEAQIRRECHERGLPELSVLAQQKTVSFENGTLRPIDFYRFRRKRGLVQPDTRGSFWRLEFDEPVTGPLTLGFGNHFGLGMFVPVE